MVFRLLLAFLLAHEPAMAQQPVAPGRIDNLTTPDQVLSFVRGLDNVNHTYAGASLQLPNVNYKSGIKYWQEYRQRADSFGEKPYEKIDLDGNGWTDLLFAGYDTINHHNLILLVLSFGTDSFCAFNLPKERPFDFFAAKTVRLHNKILLCTLEHAYFKSDVRLKNGLYKSTGGYRWQLDTLRCVSAGCVEWTRDTGHIVKSLRYHFLVGFSLDANYLLTISHDSVRLEKGCDFTPKTPIDSGGIFVAKMDNATMHKLQELLSFMDFERLKTHYQVGYSDASLGIIDIRYDHNKRKVIYDSGLAGTYGLSSLQNLLIDLLTTQTWVRIAPGGPNFFVL